MSKNSLATTPFDLDGRVCVVTGGLGLLGKEHCKALSAAGATVVVVDVKDQVASPEERGFLERLGHEADYFCCDITQEEQVVRLREQIVERFGKISVLVNNAANNPTMQNKDSQRLARLETYPMDQWLLDIAVGLTGSMLCAREFGSEMAANGGGVIVNIASDLGLIAPDQRIYEVSELPSEAQPRKPISYSVVKAGLIGMTRYLSTYWIDQGVRCNALAPGGVFSGQDGAFVERLTQLIPMGRMASPDEYHSAIQFLSSDASRYMNGSVLVVDGGRTSW